MSFLLYTGPSDSGFIFQPSLDYLFNFFFSNKEMEKFDEPSDINGLHPAINSTEHANNTTDGWSYNAQVIIRNTIIGIALCLIMTFTLVGNTLVVVAVTTYRQLRTVTNYFVVSLALADLTVAVSVMPCSAIFEVTDDWPFGWVVCYFWISCDVTCCPASHFTPRLS